MINKILVVFLFFVACQNGMNKKALSELEQINLNLIKQENVAIFSSPPLIPADHEVIVGEDISSYVNGGDECLDCHNDNDNEDVVLTRHPERYNCLQCHIPQTPESAGAGDFTMQNTFNKYNPQ